MSGGSEDDRRPYNRGVSPVLVNRIIIAISWFGFFVAGVLSIASLTGLSVPCGESRGCEIVANHPSSLFFGTQIPVSYLGLAAYFVLAILATMRELLGRDKWEQLSLASLVISGAGMGYSLYLMYVSMVQIRATCLWCLTSAVTMVVLFVLHGLMQSRRVPESSPKFTTAAILSGICLIGALGGVGSQVAKMQKSIDEFSSQASFDLVDDETIIPDPSRIKGADDAKVVIVEFADVNCPACRAAAPRLNEIYEKYRTKIQVGYRHIPLHMISGHETSIEAAMIAEYAADHDKFWEFMDKAFDPANGQRVKTVNGLLNLAEETGLDADELRKLLRTQDEALLERVNYDMVLGTQTMAMRSTPMFIVIAEGQPPKAVSINKLGELLEAEPYKTLLK